MKSFQNVIHTVKKNSSLIDDIRNSLFFNFNLNIKKKL